MIRPARPDEIPNLYTTADAKRNADTAAALTKLLKVGCVKPEWCFLAESDGKVTGSIALWTRPGHDKPTDFVLFDTDWERTPETGQTLLDHAVAASRELGADALGHVIDMPNDAPQSAVHLQTRHELLSRNGFKLTRDGRRWEWRAGEPIPASDHRLTWRSLVEIGVEPFVTLLAEILTDTKDSILLADVAELGLRGAAEELWKESEDMEHQDAWYEIGFDADGTAAAVSLPSRNPTMAVIGFVGVSPRHRNKGYSASVVVRSTRILAEAGADAIRGDCDTVNVAMSRGFQRAGYCNFMDRKEYQKQLSAAKE